MSNERPHHELGYSRWDKLAACLHFKGKPVGKAAKRGTDIHAEVEKVILGGHTENETAAMAAQRIRGYLKNVLSVEEQLAIQDESFNEVAYGYADYVGLDEDGTLTVVDLKTGIQPPESYRLQLTGLAYAAMEQYEKTHCKCVLVYADSDDDAVFEITLEEAAEASWDLINLYKAKQDTAPQENDYCSWCANRETCPVWVKPIKTLVAMDEAAEIAAAGFSKEAILANPETASRFWSAYKKFTSLVEDWGVDEKIKGWIAEGQTVPGWKTQNRKGRQSVDSEAVLREVVGKIGQAKAAKFITIKVPDLIKTWEGFTSEPLPVEIIEGEATVSLVAAKGGK